MNTKIIKLFLLFILLLNTFLAEAKISSKDEMEVIRTGAIFENNVINGYYCFYVKEKQGRNNLFFLEIINRSLETKQSIEMVMDRQTIVKKVVSSGNAFAVEYASTHPEKPKSSIEFYDASGKKLNSWEKEGAVNMTFESVKNVGYVRLENNFSSEKKVAIVFLDNSGKQIWEFVSERMNKIKRVDGLLEYADEKTIAVQCLGTDHQSIFFIDTKTGKETFSYDLKEKGYYYDYQRIDLHIVNNQIVMYGQENIYNEKNKLDMHAGFFVKIFELTGKPVLDKHFNWTKNLAQYVTFKEESREINRKMLFFDLIKSGDNFYAVCQKYNTEKKEVLTDSSLIMDRKSLTPSTFRYFVIFQLNKNMEVEKVKLAPTELKSYNFIEKSEDEMEFSIVACDGALNTIKDVAVTSFFDPIKDQMLPGGKTSYIHSVTMDKSGKLTSNKLELDGKSKYISVYPALPGEIVYMFYREKGKGYERKIISLN